MVNRAFKAIRRADVVLLMVDVEAGITEQVRYPLYHVLTSGRCWPLRIELPLDILCFAVRQEVLVSGRRKGMEGEEGVTPVLVIDEGGGGDEFENPLL